MKFDPEERLSLVRDFFISLASASVSRGEQEVAAGFFSAYQPLSNQEALQLHKELAIVEPDAMRDKVMQLTNPFIELGIQRGIRQGIRNGVQKGRYQGEVELVLRPLKRRLGPLSRSQRSSIRKLDLAQVEALGEALLEFDSSAHLTRWLQENARGNS